MSTSTRSQATSTSSSSAAATTSALTCTAGGLRFRDGQRYTEDGLTYVIHCSQDNSQSSYEAQSISSGGFSKCFSLCRGSSECQGFTYSGTDFGTCYLKSREGQYSPAVSTIVSAFLVGKRPVVETTGSSTITLSHSSTPISAAPSTKPTGSSFNCRAVGTTDGQYTPYTDSNGVSYETYCKNEIGGFDLSAAAAPSFGDCFPLCDNLPGCAGFAWLQDDGPGNCYFKSDFNGRSTLGSSRADVAIMVNRNGYNAPTKSSGAPAQPTGSSTPGGCSDLDASQFPGYTTECKTDRRGGDFRAVQAQSFSACYPLCDQFGECIGFSYLGGKGPGTCYLKSNLVAPTANANVDTAYKKGADAPGASQGAGGGDGPAATGGGAQGGSASGTVSATAGAGPGSTSSAAPEPTYSDAPEATESFPPDTTESDTPSATSSGTPNGAGTPGKRSCDQFGGKTFMGYTLECDTDRDGGNLKAVGAGTFEQCFGICNGTSGCVGFAWTGDSGPGTCYLKSTLVTTNSNPAVDVAYKTDALPGGSNGSGQAARSMTTSSAPSTMSTMARTASA